MSFSFLYRLKPYHYMYGLRSKISKNFPVSELSTVQCNTCETSWGLFWRWVFLGKSRKITLKPKTKSATRNINIASKPIHVEFVVITSYTSSVQVVKFSTSVIAAELFAIFLDKTYIFECRDTWRAIQSPYKAKKYGFVAPLKKYKNTTDNQTANTM